MAPIGIQKKYARANATIKKVAEGVKMTIPTAVNDEAPDNLDPFIKDAPNDILKEIEKICRRKYLANIAKEKYNTAHETVILAHADFNQHVKDIEKYFANGVPLTGNTSDTHVDFRIFKRWAVDQVSVTNTKVISDLDLRKNTALPGYADLCKMQDDCITQFSAMIKKAADFLIEAERV
tara:strand:+ start:38 stop:574 length:537 start_codon:yes stop_codon:yes gene_type:complete